jgi:signal transduction histidine kinase
VLCAPLVVDGEVIGVIQFDHRSRPGPFTEEDLTVLELFAHQAATALKNLLLVERLEESAEKVRDSQTRLLAGERLRALGEMSAGVAHDFNNLLTVITGITDMMLEKTDLPGQVRADLELLASVSKTASGTIRRLQTFRGQSAEFEARARLDPAQVARQAAEMGLRRQMDIVRHPITLELGSVPEVLGQEPELRDVLLNLIINAEEAMTTGGPITVRAREEAGCAVLEVEDRGPGVPPELRSAIFEPHFSTKRAGNGLGLWLARGTVHRMGGTLVHEPVAGGGARFRIVLPAAGPEPPAGRPVAGPRGPGAVLVVDDDPGVREIVCRLVAASGLRPVPSGSGREALALLERERFDLVLTDYAMPGMNGDEVAREIHRRRADLPVVLLTGRSAQGYVPPRTGESFQLILEKPITRKKLALALELCAPR